MLCHNERLMEYKWMGVNYELCKTFNEVYRDVTMGHDTILM
jgi:hypothetical protein